MRPIILTTLLFIVSIGLMAQQDINLPQVIITGETEIFSDSTRKSSDLSSYWSLENPAGMQYAWYPESKALEPMPEDTSASGLIQGLLGSQDFGSLRFDYHDDKSSPLRFSGAFNTMNLDDGWEQAKGDFHWQPTFHNHLADVYIDWSRYDSRLQNYSTQNTGFGFTLKSNETKVVGPVTLANPYFILEYYAHKQDSDIDGLDEREAGDINILYRRDVGYRDIDSRIEVAYLKNMFSGSFNAHKNNFLGFDQLGAWVGGDGMHIYPSVWFVWQHQLFYQTKMKILNMPYTGTLTRMQLLKQNPYQNIDMEKHQPKAPLNLTAAFEIDTIFPITIYNTIRWIKDYPVYAHADSCLYEQFIDDVIWDRIGFDASYTYERFDFVNEFSINIVQNKDGDRIPFMPAIEDLFSLTYREGQWNFTLQAHYLHDRENDDETTMENVLLTNILGNWRFYPDFELSGGIYNLLDEKYREYRELPAHETHFELGLCWYF